MTDRRVDVDPDDRRQVIEWSRRQRLIEAYNYGCPWPDIRLRRASAEQLKACAQAAQQEEERVVGIYGAEKRKQMLRDEYWSERRRKVQSI